MIRQIIVCVPLALAACGPRGLAPAPHVVRGCNPLSPAGFSGQGSVCLVPFPSSWWEEGDPRSPTGLRVVFPAGAPRGVLPANSDGVPLDPALFGGTDGFSPATPIVVFFPQGVDGRQLPDQNHISDSLSAAAPIVLVDLATGNKVPYFAELDANANPAAGQRQALLIHPALRLDHASRYGVAILTSLSDGEDRPLQASGAFQQWRDGQLPAGDPLNEISGRLEAVAGALSVLGIARSRLALAFDFDTDSESESTGRLLGMRDAALLAAPAGLSYAIDSVTDPGDAATDLLRVITGHFEAPSFEAGSDPALIALDEQGNAVQRGTQRFPFAAAIPRCAARQPGPVPLLIFGHGLFGRALPEMEHDQEVIGGLCMVAVGTDWLGLAQEDLPLVTARLTGDLNQLPLVTDRLLQAHVNFQVLTRLSMHALAADPALALNGRSSYDPSRVYYWGASDGGIQGATYLALSPDVTRGVLNVPGAEWSMMAWRSADFVGELLALTAAYPDKLDDQLAFALTQPLWDRTDPIEFAPHLAHPFPNTPQKEAIFQESIGDAQVPNIATEVEMRTIGAVGLTPLIDAPFGIDARPGPLDGVVLSQWNVHPTPLPAPVDVPPGDNSAHEGVRKLAASIEQIRDFFQPGGKIENPCGGPCDFPDGR